MIKMQILNTIRNLIWFCPVVLCFGCSAAQEAPVKGASIDKYEPTAEGIAPCPHFEVREVFTSVVIEAYGHPESCTVPFLPEAGGEPIRSESVANWPQASLTLKTLPPETRIKALKFKAGHELDPSEIDEWKDKLIPEQWQIDWTTDVDDRLGVERFYSSIEGLNAIATIVRSDAGSILEIKFSAAL